jgi:hypothetical protein
MKLLQLIAEIDGRAPTEAEAAGNRYPICGFHGRFL